MSHRDKNSRTSKLGEQADSPAAVISRNSSITTDDSGLHPSRIIRTTTADSEDGIRHAPSDVRGLQPSIIIRRRGSDNNHSTSVKVTRQSPARQRPREVLRSMPTEEMSEYASSDNMSTATDRSRFQNHNFAKPHKIVASQSSSGINYHGATISQAASQGNLPLCVLLWGMATAKRVRLMDPDAQGDTPMHFAALADLPEVMSFLHQQTRVKCDPQNRLVELRNNRGETPLLRASCVGKVPSLKFLLDSNSDPFVVDLEGNSIFINLTRCGCIWGLHYVYSYLSIKFGPLRTYDLLCLEDLDGHSAMHWAAFIGDVNLIEYLIRKDLDPLNTDRIGRNALHMAAVGGKLDAFIFLVKCGCSMLLEDSQGRTPVCLAAAAGFTNIVSVARSRRLQREMSSLDRGQARRGCRGRGREENTVPASLVGIDGRSWDQSGEPHSDLESGPSELRGASALPALSALKGKRGSKHENPLAPVTQCTESKKKAITLYSSTASLAPKPHALRRIKESRPLHAFIYAVVVSGYWCLALALPFYAWLVLVGLSVLYFRSAVEVAQHQQDTSATNPVAQGPMKKRYQDLLLAPERYLGIYMGTMTVCALLWLCSLRIGIRGGFEPFGPAQGGQSLYSSSLNSGGGMRDLKNSEEYLTIGGLSASTDDFNLFVAAIIALALSMALWVYLVWIGTDPGAVRSRNEDFDMIMEQSLLSAGPPSDRAFCVTSFVRKPTRSKYCAQTGFVIARMDHHCVWLNNSVGFGNHRTFTVFLLLQLAATSLFSAMIARALVREIGLDSSACGAVTYLLDRNYFLPTVFCVTLCVVSLILTALVAEQGTNMARNITANERINRSRYPWMNNDSGQPFNHYDNGIIRNILEFWFVPGYKKNYFAEFNMRPGKVSKGDLSVIKDGKGTVGAGGALSKSNGSKNSPTHSTRNQNVYIDRQKAVKRRSIAPKKPQVPSPASPTIQFNDSPMSHESPRSTRSKAHTAFQQCEKRAKRVVSAVTSTIPATGTSAGAGAGAGLHSPSGDLSTPHTADGEAQSPSDKESVAVCSRLIPQHASAPVRPGAKRTRRES